MFQSVDDISVFGLSGEVDQDEARRLAESIRNLIHSNWRKIVLDFGEVSHVHYLFLSELIPLSLVSSEKLGGIKLANLKGEIQKIFKVSGLDSFLETYDSVAEAILSFENPLTRPSVLH